MTRKDYVKVAEILAGEYALNAVLDDSYLVTDETVSSRSAGRFIIESVTASMADMFAADNPRFDRERFYFAVFGDTKVRR